VSTTTYRAWLILSIVTTATRILAMAQEYPPSVATIQDDLARGDDIKLRTDIEIGAPGSPDEIAKRLLARQLLQIGESASQSIQNGASPAASASTSLVTKSMSSILGLAQEAGAITTSTSGSTTTLTANVQQLFNYLGPDRTRCYVISPTCPFGSQLIRGASVSVSLNSLANSGTSSSSNLTSAALSGLTGVQNPVFNNFTFQENLHGRKKTDITQERFKAAIDEIEGDKKAALINAFLALVDPISDTSKGNAALTAKYVGALGECVTNLKGTRGDAQQVAKVEQDCVNSFADIVQQIPGVDGLLTNFMQAEAAYNTVRDLALTKLFYDSTFALEYDLTNNAKQPLLSTFKVVYGYQHQFHHPGPKPGTVIPGGMLQTTLNGSATLYNSLQGSSEPRVRSAQGSAQVDYTPSTSGKIQAMFSAGYYFQYMIANGLINLPSTDFVPGTVIPLPSNASVLLNTTGPINIGQGKLTLSIKGTSIKIPLAVTGASRTDLIKANRVGGNFGISYDFASLFKK